MSDSAADDLLAWLAGIEYRSEGLGEGETLFHRGSPAQRLFVVMAGSLRLLRHGADGELVVLHRAVPGDCLAEAALAADHYHCDAVAESDTVVRAYAKAAVVERLASDPEAALAWIALQARRIHHLRALLTLHRQRGAEARVLGFLRLIADDHGVVSEPRPWRALAQDIGLSHEAFYRALASLERGGYLSRDGRRIALLTGAP